MDYWPSIPWNAVVTSSNRAKTIELTSPFALIGSHPVCNIRIKKSRVPPVAYLAVCLEDAIEVWPLCALAYSQWGVLDKDQSLRIGRKLIQLASTSEIDNSNEPKSNKIELDKPKKGNAIRESPVLEVGFGNKTGSFVLDRRIVILGSDHPSTRRLHGVGLTKCEQAIVTINQQCWLINLNPQKEKSLLDLVKPLPIDGEPVAIGNIKISARLQDPAERTSPKKNHKNLPVASGKHRYKASSRSSSKRQTVHSNVNALAEPEGESPESSDSDLDFGMDDVTSVITDRLVSISRSHWWQRRFVKLVSIGLLFLVAMSTFLWITTQLVLPVLIDLQNK